MWSDIETDNHNIIGIVAVKQLWYISKLPAYGIAACGQPLP